MLKKSLKKEILGQNSSSLNQHDATLPSELEWGVEIFFFLLLLFSTGQPKVVYSK